MVGHLSGDAFTICHQGLASRRTLSPRGPNVNDGACAQREVRPQSKGVMVNEKDGAGAQTRTADLLITNQLLYQLSYAGEGCGIYTGFRRAESPA